MVDVFIIVEKPFDQLLNCFGFGAWRATDKKHAIGYILLFNVDIYNVFQNNYWVLSELSELQILQYDYCVAAGSYIGNKHNNVTSIARLGNFETI